MLAGIYPFIVALHIVLCVFLVLIILLQPGKGGDIGAAFGGASAGNMFGPRGPTSLLQRATTVVAVLFMVTSATLAYYSSPKMLDNSNTDEALERLQQEEEAGSDEVGEDVTPDDE